MRVALYKTETVIALLLGFHSLDLPLFLLLLTFFPSRINLVMWEGEGERT